MFAIHSQQWPPPLPNNRILQVLMYQCVIFFFPSAVPSKLSSFIPFAGPSDSFNTGGCTREDPQHVRSTAYWYHHARRWRDTTECLPVPYTWCWWTGTCLCWCPFKARDPIYNFMLKTRSWDISTFMNAIYVANFILFLLTTHIEHWYQLSEDFHWSFVKTVCISTFQTDLFLKCYYIWKI